MSEPGRRWTDQQVEQIVGNLLRAGVVLAALVVLAGGPWFLVQHGAEVPDYTKFRGEPEELRSLPGVVHFTLAGHSRGVIQLGLLLLIATPVARVAFSVVAFVLQRDRIYVVITLLVLAVLAYSLAQ
jgi:uncharacterized membrane protein